MGGGAHGGALVPGGGLGYLCPSKQGEAPVALGDVLADGGGAFPLRLVGGLLLSRVFPLPPPGTAGSCRPTGWPWQTSSTRPRSPAPLSTGRPPSPSWICGWLPWRRRACTRWRPRALPGGPQGWEGRRGPGSGARGGRRQAPLPAGPRSPPRPSCTCATSGQTAPSCARPRATRPTPAPAAVETLVPPLPVGQWHHTAIPCTCPPRKRAC